MIQGNFDFDLEVSTSSLTTHANASLSNSHWPQAELGISILKSSQPRFATTSVILSSSFGSRFSEADSKMEIARDMFFDAVTVPTSGDFDDDGDDFENDSNDDVKVDSCRVVNRLRLAQRDFPSVLVTFGVMNAVSWAPFFLLLLAEPLLG